MQQMQWSATRLLHFAILQWHLFFGFAVSGDCSHREDDVKLLHSWSLQYIADGLDERHCQENVGCLRRKDYFCTNALSLSLPSGLSQLLSFSGGGRALSPRTVVHLDACTDNRGLLHATGTRPVSMQVFECSRTVRVIVCLKPHRQTVGPRMPPFAPYVPPIHHIISFIHPCHPHYPVIAILSQYPICIFCIPCHHINWTL